MIRNHQSKIILSLLAVIACCVIGLLCSLIIRQNFSEGAWQSALRTILDACYRFLSHRGNTRFFENLPPQFQAILLAKLAGYCDYFTNNTQLIFQAAENCLNYYQ